MIIRTWILLSLATLAAAAPAKWRQSYDAGYFDAQGKWAGGSEIMHLAAHAGSLYAANGYWLDARWVIPPEGQKQSAQVLRCLLYTSPSPRDATLSRMPSSA